MYRGRQPQQEIQQPVLRSAVEQFSANNQPDHEYLDVQVYNAQTLSGAAPPVLTYLCKFNNGPFLSNPKDYYMSIIRMNLNLGNSIPVWIPQILPGVENTDPNLTVYSMTLSYTDGSGNTVEFQKFLEWNPQNINAQVPPAPSANGGLMSVTAGNLTESYYYAFDYQWVIIQLNQCMQAAYNGLVAAAADASITLPGTAVAPFFSYDNQTGNVSLYAPYNGYNNQATTYIKIFVNTNTYDMLASMPFIVNNYSNLTLGKNFQLVLNSLNSGLINVISLPFFNTDSSYNALFTSTTKSPTSAWSPVSKVFFTCSSINVVNNVETPVQQIYNNQPLTLSGTTQVSNEITNFIADNNDYTGQLLYQANPYRLIDMKGDSPLDTIALQGYFTTLWGVSLPIRIPSSGSATFKFGFFKKTAQVSS